MKDAEYAQRVCGLRDKLYKTAMLYVGSHSLAVDVLDEAIYKGLRSHTRLRNEAYFDTWMTKILINECHNELRRQKRLCPMEEWTESAADQFDALPLKEAVRHLPEEMRDVVILRYFTGLTLVETAAVLKIPQGTAASRQRRALKLLRLELEEAEEV